MRQALRWILLFSVPMLLSNAACSKAPADGTITVAGKQYRVLDRRRITGPGWTALGVQYEWEGSEESTVLNENAIRLLTAVGPDAVRAGYGTIIFMAVAASRGTTVNVGYQYVDGAWKELKKGP